jgi:glycosyltransferase-like protein
MHKLRIAICSHSTNPRGGVVHALALGDALVRLGHQAVVHAPDVNGSGFFRSSLCQTVAIPASAAGNVPELVAKRRAEYGQYFSRDGNRDFDVFHAQDSISANALADLKRDGKISRFARTVHHVDRFDEPVLTMLQARGIASADRHFVVSRQWQLHLDRHFGIQAEIVANGVDTQIFSAKADASDAQLRGLLRLGGGPILLAIGGIEERKNSLRILQAFARLRGQYENAQLIVVGGASLLDHSDYQRAFHGALSARKLPENSIIITGPLPQVLMPALYRAADMLVFPSTKEGFGLAVLEAMASGIPAVTSSIAPFTEYLKAQDAAWCDPYDVASIAAAMRQALEPLARQNLVRRGLTIAARHDWRQVAVAHLTAYAALREPEHA